MQTLLSSKAVVEEHHEQRLYLLQGKWQTISQLSFVSRKINKKQ
jgi:hypothetical protein